MGAVFLLFPAFRPAAPCLLVQYQECVATVSAKNLDWSLIKTPTIKKSENAQQRIFIYPIWPFCPPSHTFKHTIPLGQPKPPALPDLYYWPFPPETPDPPDSPNSPVSLGSPEPPVHLTYQIYLTHLCGPLGPPTDWPTCPTDPPNHTCQQGLRSRNYLIWLQLRLRLSKVSAPASAPAPVPAPAPTWALWVPVFTAFTWKSKIFMTFGKNIDLIQFFDPI